MIDRACSGQICQQRGITMPKTLKIAGISLFCALALLGCDLFTNTDFSQAKGEWEFPNITQINSIQVKEVSLSVMGDS